MDKKIINLMMEKPITIPRMIFNNYKRLNITEEELIVLIFIIDFGGRIVYNPDIFVNELKMEKFKVMELLNSLYEKKIITISVEKNNNNKSEEFISLDLLYSKMLNLFKDSTPTDSNIDNTDIFSVFEKELGKTISPMEYEIIKGWINDKFSYEIIIEALKEAVLNNVTSLRYIDKILYDWKKKGIKNKEDIIRDKNNYRANKNKTKEVFDYNWLEDE